MCIRDRPKSGSLYAIENMEFDEWALYSVFHMVHLGSGLHFPLPFQPNDLLYSPGSPDTTEPTILEGVFIAEQMGSYHTVSYTHLYNRQKKKDRWCPRFL